MPELADLVDLTARLVDQGVLCGVVPDAALALEGTLALQDDGPVSLLEGDRVEDDTDLVDLAEIEEAGVARGAHPPVGDGDVPAAAVPAR